MQPIVNNIFSTTTDSFLLTALQVFQYQYQNNQVYKQWVDALKVDVDSIQSIEQIPFMPISFFKTHRVVCNHVEAQQIFESSGTTGIINSKHFVQDVSIYEQSFLNGFKRFYGEVTDWCIIGLLPSYLERNNSSLVMMVDSLIKNTRHPASGFYLHEFESLYKTLKHLESSKTKTLLIGVTFALLDFAEQYPMHLKHTIVMDTGGMKGRRKEMVRDEIHNTLKKQFNIKTIHSEYGMTELLSQAYSTGDGIFTTIPWMKVVIRDEEDPLGIKITGRGGLNIIDLANINSCSFIATDDVGECFGDGTFVVNGRIDEADIRGCSLLYN